jgi:hypothetical protein
VLSSDSRGAQAHGVKPNAALLPLVRQNRRNALISISLDAPVSLRSVKDFLRIVRRMLLATSEQQRHAQDQIG